MKLCRAHLFRQWVGDHACDDAEYRFFHPAAGCSHDFDAKKGGAVMLKDMLWLIRKTILTSLKDYKNLFARYCASHCRHSAIYLNL